MKIKHQQLSGLIGPVIAYRVGENTYFRTRPAHFTDHRTRGQLCCRSRLTAAQRFLSPILPLVKPFYLEPEGQLNYYNALTRWLLSGAFGDGSDVLLPEQACVFHGSLLPLADAVAHGSDTQLVISWTDNSLTALARPDDHLVLLCYDVEHYQGWISELRDVVRAQEYLIIGHPFVGGSYHVYVSFVNRIHTKISDSVHLFAQVC